MHRRRKSLPALLAAVTLATTACQGLHGEEPKLSRGHQWIRSHPFWISALTQNGKLYEVDEYRTAGLNTLLAWDPRPLLFQKSVDASFPIHYHIHQNHGETVEDYVQHVRQLVQKYPGCTGLLFYDEPRVPAMTKVRDVCQALRGAFPHMLVYSNAMPKGAIRPAKYGFGADAPSDFYAAYIEQFARVVQGDVLMLDIYPLGQGGGHSRVYFETLTLARQWGLRTGVPYWVIIQAYDHGGQKRRPSESDLRFQLFTPLAYGFTGISYFTYDPALGPGLIDGNRKRTPLYYHAGRANLEVAHLGRTLRFLTSTGIAFVLGRHTADGKSVENEMPPMPPPGPWVWRDVKRRPRQLKDVHVAGRGQGHDALLGFFEDDQGDAYLMVTNLWHEKQMSAAECAQTVTLSFTPDVKQVTRLARETGEPEMLVVHNGSLRLRLPGGTGDLFKLGSGSFPGLPDRK